jgi:sensor histidine kinase YesM
MNLSSEIIMEDSDLYLLLSNLIDNAITHIGIEKKIRIIIRDVLDTIMIQVRNSVDGTVISKDGTFLYMDRSEEHGYGLTTIKLLTDKYDGEFIIEQDGQEAVCSVFIPQKQQAPQQD